MELSLIGLNAAGKTSLVNVIAVSSSAAPLQLHGSASSRLPSPQTGSFSDDMIPTVGFNMRKVTKGNVSIKVRAARRASPSPLARSLTPRGSCGTWAGRHASAACGSDTAEA